jgi:uncharacterized protein YjbI with pentapeptide repeats
MAERDSTCQIHINYWSLKCQKPALPDDPYDLCILHSQNTEKDPDDFKEVLQTGWEQKDLKYYDLSGVFFPSQFDPEDYFGSRQFDKPMTFSRATFNSDADFSGSTFWEWVSFFKAKFGWASFSGITFTEWGDFSLAFFTEWGDFSGTTFEESADFTKATFAGEVTFSGANFRGKVDFASAIFSGKANFTDNTFIGEVIFKGATIGGQVIIKGVKTLGEEGVLPPFVGSFKSLEFQDRGALRFQDVSLSYVEFAGTDLRRMEFRHVTWYRLRGGRQAIYDEVLLRRKELSFGKRLLSFIGLVSIHDLPTANDYGEVERLYRNLKDNYEKASDYKNAGDFHYGELEMHRRASKWRWFPFYWNNLYRVLSGYGEQPLRALGWLSIFLVGMAGLVWELGLEVGNPPYLAGFGDSFIYLLQKATLQRPTWAEPAGFGGKLVAGFSVLLIPGQAALFLLALRNRLGRRR